MPQEFQVLQCYKCETFQVQQVKKVLKWNCKLCGEKQSIRKVYGRGSGVDCRKHVQQLNTMRGELASLRESSAVTLPQSENGDKEECNQICEDAHLQNMNPSSSKWSQYAEEKEETGVSEEDDPRITTDRQYFSSKRKAGMKRKTTENKPGASKYRRWENRHDEHDTDFHYNNDRETSIKAPPAAGSVQRFNVHQSDKPSSGVFGISYKPNRGPQDVEDIRHQNEVKGLPERFSNSVNSRSKWGQFTETKSDDQDTCTLDYGTYKQGEVKILPKQFGSPVNSRSKWQQYTNTDVDYQDALDYGTYKQGQVKDLPKQSGISFKSRSKWEQYTETDVDDLGIVDYGTYKQCEPKPGISVESRSKWGQYTETEVDNEDAVDYGTYEQDGTNSDWVTSDEAIIDNKTSGRDYLSFEQGHPTNFEHEEDNLDCFKGSSFYEKKSETQTFAPSLIKNEGKKTREFSSKTKHSLSSYNNNSKWSKFINEDCSHETEEDGNDLNALSKSRPNDPSELRDRVHHPLTDGGKIHNPLTELDRNKAKRETDTASHIGMTCMDFPSEHMTISNSKVIHSDSNSGLLLQPKENITTNSQKENKLLFTVGELSDDDFDL